MIFKSHWHKYFPVCLNFSDCTSLGVIDIASVLGYSFLKKHSINEHLRSFSCICRIECAKSISSQQGIILNALSMALFDGGSVFAAERFSLYHGPYFYFILHGFFAVLDVGALLYQSFKDEAFWAKHS